MKTLWLARHAHAGEAGPGVRDFDRPLSERGRRAVPAVAIRLKSREASLPQRIVCSPAARTLETAELFALQFGLEEADIQPEGALYLAGESRLLESCRQLDNRFEAIMLVGHNPAVTELLNGFCDNVSVDHVPSGGCACLLFDVHGWNEVAPGMAELHSFDHPSIG
ncbi:MAG: histidine phosphatase family protein [Pseudohongiellaceae bacterium]